MAQLSDVGPSVCVDSLHCQKLSMINTIEYLKAEPQYAEKVIDSRPGKNANMKIHFEEMGNEQQDMLTRNGMEENYVVAREEARCDKLMEQINVLNRQIHDIGDEIARRSESYRNVE